jgi:hypothetical protein
MVEFCLCPRLDAIELHYARRKEFQDVARIILNSGNGPVQFPSVPLRGISVWYTTPEPCFLFVYDATILFALNECFDKLPKPPVQDRLWLALQYIEAIAALHKDDFWHGLFNYFNVYIQIPTGECDGATGFSLRRTSPRLAGFEILRQMAGFSDLIDVESREQRIFLHPERLLQGDWKERQRPEHDLFSFGILMIAIGLWTSFASLKKYIQANTEKEARSFVEKLGKQFSGDGTDNEMPGEYAKIISHCLGKSPSSLGQAVLGEGGPKPSWQNASCIAVALSKLLST